MPRGRRKSTVDVTSLEQELAALKQRQLELRQQIRRMKGSQTEISKLEEKLGKQLGTAKWLVEQIKAIRSDWDEMAFYQSVQPRQPAPRGRRRRVETEAGAEAEA